MRLTRVRAHNLRCFENLDFEPGAGLNVVLGGNASGKTTILEAIFMLGRGQSFRGKTLGSMVRRGHKALTLHGEIENEDQRKHRIGLTSSGPNLTYRLDNNSQTRRFDLVTALPLQLIDPNLHRLLEQGPRFRRKFMDWGVFHVEHHFFQAWRQYRRTLRQRNRALKTRQSESAVTAWDQQLMQTAETIDACRRRYVARLSAILPETVSHVLGEDAPSIAYYPGWNVGNGFAASLSASVGRDMKAGYTHVGPHRADLRLDIDGDQARTRVSRGQQKILVAMLLLAQARILFDDCAVKPILLVDDIAAELGSNYLQALMREIDRLDGQCVVTCLDANHLPELPLGSRMFHVEHGVVRPE